MPSGFGESSFLVLCKNEKFFKRSDNQDVNPVVYTGDLMNILFHPLCIRERKILKDIEY